MPSGENADIQSESVGVLGVRFTLFEPSTFITKMSGFGFWREKVIRVPSGEKPAKKSLSGPSGVRFTLPLPSAFIT